MITIKVSKDRLQATGHADYSIGNEDIVCSAVSCLMQTLELRGIATKRKGNMIVFTDDKEALKLIVEGLKQVAENYPKNVEVVE